MNYSKEQIEEMEMLLLFNINSTQEGIKVHSRAGESAVATARRLYQKGLITQIDGGYLTRIGYQAAEHAHRLRSILN
jgi:uncharacterized protein (TIGR02647 family)